MKNKKGFTLIELLAVIVILGLLMAIAIPSVTKYITQSRKKTVISTIGNYITAMINEVNDLTYTFTEANTVYAVPIECIALERGGTNPLGLWHQANDAYWAYVLVQYDDETSSYTYGYTFKDSAGYGLYPTSQSKLNEQGKQIQTGLNLSRPKSAKTQDLTNNENWQGFAVDAATNLKVLEPETEGVIGDGKDTCTLVQKGNNYASIEEEKLDRLVNIIKANNTIKVDEPNLNTTSGASGEKGLYKSNMTENGNSTYYFRGSVDNNYVSFAGQTWRILRINEDGTVRLIMQNGINSDTYYNIGGKSFYYSDTRLKTILEQWYESNLKEYDEYIATSTYCEEAKVKSGNGWNGINANMELNTKYEPNFKCKTDGNGKGIIISKIGLITYDELVYAGGYYYVDNTNNFLNNGKYFWTMSPFGTGSGGTALWGLNPNGLINGYYLGFKSSLRPVISVYANTLSSGEGTSLIPYVIETK